MIPRDSLKVSSSSLAAISRVLRSGYLTSGPLTHEFEEKFASYIGTRYSVAVSSGTAALHLALLACGVRAGSEVIMPSFTYHAAADAIIYCGARPVLVDVDPRTMCLDPQSVPQAISSKTCALVATHFAGHPCDMKQIREIAEENDLAIIEDAAHSTGTQYYGKMAGSLGEAGCFSFYPTKPLTTAEGGMITTNDPKIAERASHLRALGTDRSKGLQYDVRSLGFTYRMSELHAALGLNQLQSLNQRNSIMRTKAKTIIRKLRNLEGLILPFEAQYARHVYNLFVVRILARQFGMDRNTVSSRLRKVGIETQLHYVPIHRLTYFARKAKFSTKRLKVSDSLWKTVLSLPLYPTIREGELEKVSDAVLRCAHGL